MGDEGARREEFADGGGDGLAFTFGLAGVLKDEVVLVCGCKKTGDVSDAVSWGTSYIERACVEVR